MNVIWDVEFQSLRDSTAVGDRRHKISAIGGSNSP